MYTDVFNNLMSQFLYTVSDSEIRGIYVAVCYSLILLQNGTSFSFIINRHVLIQGGFVITVCA